MTEAVRAQAHARDADEAMHALIELHQRQGRAPAPLLLAHDYLATYCELTGLAHAPRTEDGTTGGPHRRKQGRS